MTRQGRRRTGGTPAGLFRWGPHGEVPDEVRDNPLLRPCPWCHAGPRQRCRRRARGGWAEIDHFHPARETTAQVDQEPTAMPPQRPAEPRTDLR